MGRGGAFHRKKNKGAVAAAAVAAPSTSDTVVLDHKPWYQSGPLSPFYLLWSALWLRALWLVRLIRGQKEAITIETQAVTVSTQLSCTRDEPESVESVHNDEPIPSASESAPVVREEPVEIVEDEQEAGPSTAASVQDQDEDEDETEEYEEDRQSTSSEEQAPVVRKEARVEYVNQYPVVSSMDEPDYPEERYGGCSVELHRTSIEEVDEEDIDDESEDLGRSSSLSCCGPEDEDEDYDCASSSSEKNASNDSAICVQSPVAQPTPVEEEKVVVVEEPTPVAADEAAVEDVVQEREEKEEEEADQPADVEEPLVKKLEQLVIEESVSQEEAESEPSTPAPVTPSVSETAANLAEEEEDAEKAEEERLQKMEEERQKRRADLEAAIAQNMEDIDQVNEEIGRYNREYLYNVRDLEKYFHVTPCPLTPDELKNFGICRSLVSNEPRKKQDGQGGFMPGWARSGGGGGRGGGPKPYTGRQSEQHQRGGGGRHGSNKKLPPSIRPSIERRVETNVQLHKAEKAWKPEKVTDAADLEDEEVKKKLLLKTIRALFNKITPTTKEALINEFLDHKVYQSPALNEVISVIFDKAVEEPKFCPLYSNMCNTQVAEELKLNNNVSLFRNAILVRAQETFTTKNLDDYVAEKQAEIEAETDEKKKKEKQIELLETQSKFRRRKFGNITFIGQLYLQGLISIRIIHFCVVDLLKSVAKTAEPVEPDEESIDCAVRLLETIGKRLHEESVRANKEAANAAAAAKNAPKVIQRGAPVPKPQSAPTQQFPLELTFQTLEGATSNVSSRIKFMIMNLVELRRNGWVPRKGADAGPKKLDEIKKDIQKEQMENQHQQQMYERKQSRQEPMGGRGMGGGGGHGGHGGNPKRQVIQRNSTDRGNIEERRAQAYKSSNLPPSKAPAKKASLSTVTATEKTSLGGGAKKWSHGASGGSENSKKEERAGAIQQTSRFMQQRSSSAASMKEDEGAGASGNATQVNSEDEREANELREKQEADIAKRVVCDVGDYGTGEITLEEVREEVFKIVGQEKFGSPSLQLVFKCFMTAAVKKVTTASETGPKFGHVLAFCLLKKADEKDTKSRDEMLKGVADSCREVVEQEQWEDAPKIWDIFAEVLINAHVAEEGLFEGAHPTLNDFKDAFLHAAKDTRKPYTLFVLVLKRLAEFHHKRDKDAVMEVMSWVLDECETIVKKMDKKKLDKALEDTTTNFDGNLHKIMNENRH